MVVSELQRRRRDGLLESLEAPHPEAAELADAGLADWVAGEPEGESLVDLAGGRPVHWIPGVGWDDEGK